MYKKIEKLDIFKIFEQFHIPLWITKDMFWMMGYGELSFIFAVPAIILSMALIIIKKGSDRYMEIMMAFWLTANTLWMSHELFRLPTKEWALFCFILGILTIPIYLYKIKKSS